MTNWNGRHLTGETATDPTSTLGYDKTAARFLAGFLSQLGVVDFNREKGIIRPIQSKPTAERMEVYRALLLAAVWPEPSVNLLNSAIEDIKRNGLPEDGFLELISGLEKRTQDKVFRMLFKQVLQVRQNE